MARQEYDHALTLRINAQCERIEALLGLDDETIGTYGQSGIILNPDQVDALLAHVVPDVCRCPECGCYHQPN